MLCYQLMVEVIACYADEGKDTGRSLWGSVAVAVDLLPSAQPPCLTSVPATPQVRPLSPPDSSGLSRLSSPFKFWVFPWEAGLGSPSPRGSAAHCCLSARLVSVSCAGDPRLTGREAALAWASPAKRFPASSVLARAGAGCGSAGDVTGAWLASAPLWPSLWIMW